MGLRHEGMASSRASAAKETSPPMPSVQAMAEQLGVDRASEPNLLHVLSNMQMTSLPPTWSAVEAVQPVVKVDGGQDSPHRAPSAADCLDAPRLEYVNCVTGERTSQHPGARYFRGVVDEERKLQRGVRQGRPVSGSSTVRSARQLPRGVVVTTRGTLPQESPVTPTKKANSDTLPAQEDTVAATILTRQARNHDVDESTSAGATYRRSTRGKRRRRVPKWLVFTSWWRETTSGEENVVNKNHALVRYHTATGAFEVELESIPAVFEVSHATGRYGKVETVDMRVGAHILILGRQVVLKQCDGLTAKWLESEVKAIAKAKATLIAALERGGHDTRIRCRSDRLQAAASIQRGGDSVGYAASMDRRSLLQDVVNLRDLLAQRQPDEARRLTQAVL